VRYTDADIRCRLATNVSPQLRDLKSPGRMYRCKLMPTVRHAAADSSHPGIIRKNLSSKNREAKTEKQNKRRKP
jgi:hypothetical protein